LNGAGRRGFENAMPLFPAAPADLPDVVALVNGAYRGEGGWTHEAAYLEGLRTTVDALRGDLEAQPEARLLVWRDAPDAGIAGCVWLEPAGAGTWYLGLLSVPPARQDQRLGRTILEAAEAFARERGATRMRLTVINIRDTLIAWYERRGYARTGETKAFPYGDERFGRALRDDLGFVVLERVL
jgi:ribosomal protein S18 acetylase RimI-like enzyme